MSGIKSIIERAYQQHVSMFLSSSIEGDGARAFIYGSLYRKPAIVHLLIETDGARTPLSFKFKDRPGNKAPKTRADDILKFAEKVLKEQKYADAAEDQVIERSSASEIIDELGFFGRRAVSEDAIVSSFEQCLEACSETKDEFAKALKLVDRKALVNSELRRLRGPAKSLKGLNIHPEIFNALIRSFVIT